MYCKNYKVSCTVTAFNNGAYLKFIFRSESDDEVSLFIVRLFSFLTFLFLNLSVITLRWLFPLTLEPVDEM